MAGTTNKVKNVPMTIPGTSTRPMLFLAPAPGPVTNMLGRNGKRLAEPLPSFLVRIAVGVLFVPVPRALHNLMDILKFRCPSQLLFCFFRCRNQPRRIPWPPWLFYNRNFVPGYSAASFDDFVNRYTSTSS